MDETTTDAATQEPGVTTTQPDEQPAEAVTTPDSEPTQPVEGEETTPDAPAEPADKAPDDFDYQAWLEKKGIDPSTDEGKAQIAKSWRELEKRMHSTTQEASELKKSLVDQPVTVDTDNPLVQSLAEEVVTMKRQQNIDQFVSEVNLTTEKESAFAEFVTNTPNMADLINGGYLTLKQAYQLSGVGTVDPSEYKSQGKQEALQTLANKQRTTAPRGAASQPTAPSKDDPIMKALLAD